MAKRFVTNAASEPQRLGLFRAMVRQRDSYLVKEMVYLLATGRKAAMDYLKECYLDAPITAVEELSAGVQVAGAVRRG